MAGGKIAASLTPFIMKLGFGSRSRFFLALSLFGLTAGGAHAQTQAAPEAGAPPKLTVSVFFDKAVLPQHDTLQAHLWLSNDSDSDLTGVDLHVSAPEHLEWSDGACPNSQSSSAKLGAALALGSIAAHATNEHTLCLRSDSSVEPGDFSIPFVFEPSWHAGGKLRSTLVVAEKPLKVAFFGSDTLAGIPLALAGLIVPGLFFWLVLQCFRVPWGVGLALGDKMIYSVLVSVAILAVGAWASHLTDSGWLGYLDLNQGMSVAKLFWMALSGAILGGLALLVYASWRHFRREEIERRTIRITDDTLALLGKILRNKQTSLHPNTMVRLKNGETYYGSLGLEGPELTALVGWFRVEDDPAHPGVVQSLKPFARRGEMLRVYEEASGKARFVTRSNVEQLLNGKHRAIGEDSLLWSSGDVARITTWETPNGDAVIELT